MNKRYNGWSNYETWCVNLHLTNDQGLYRYARSFTSAEELKDELTDEVYTLIETQATIAPLLAMMYQDLLLADMSTINWWEIYDSLHEGDKEEDEND